MAGKSGKTPQGTVPAAKETKTVSESSDNGFGRDVIEVVT